MKKQLEPFFREKYGFPMEIYTFMIHRHYNSFSTKNILKNILRIPVGKTLLMSGIGYLMICFFPIIMSGFLILMIGALLLKLFSPFFYIQHPIRYLNNIHTLANMKKYNSPLSFLFKPFISSIIPDTNSLAQKLYTDSIERIQDAIRINELGILHIFGTEKTSFEDYRSFSMISINNLSNFSITFNIIDFYTKSYIASANAYGAIEKHNNNVVLEKILITNNNNEKIILHNSSNFKKGYGKTIDAERWSTKSIH